MIIGSIWQFQRVFVALLQDNARDLNMATNVEAVRWS